MADVLLSYDVRKTSSTIHTEVKDRLISNYGYFATIKAGDGKLYYLPNTTLRKGNSTPEKSAADFRSACKDVGAIWEKFFVTEYSNSRFNNQNP